MSLKRFHCTAWKAERELFSLTCEHETSGRAIRLAFLPPEMEDRVPTDALMFNFKGYTYTAEEF